MNEKKISSLIIIVIVSVLLAGVVVWFLKPQFVRPQEERKQTAESRYSVAISSGGDFITISKNGAVSGVISASNLPKSCFGKGGGKCDAAVI